MKQEPVEGDGQKEAQASTATKNRPSSGTYGVTALQSAIRAERTN